MHVFHQSQLGSMQCASVGLSPHPVEDAVWGQEEASPSEEN